MSYSTSITIDDCKTEAPINATQIGASSSVVSDANLTTWLGEAEGIISALADSNGVTIDDSSAVKVADRAVKAFVIANMLRTLKQPAAVVAEWWNEWIEMRGIVEGRIQALGNDFSASAQLPSNINTSEPTARRFRGDSSSGGDGFTGW